MQEKKKDNGDWGFAEDLQGKLQQMSFRWKNFEQFEILKLEYNSIYDDLAQGAIVRSKVTWCEKGENSNKYFLNLESHKKSKKLCP